MANSPGYIAYNTGTFAIKYATMFDVFDACKDKMEYDGWIDASMCKYQSTAT